MNFESENGSGAPQIFPEVLLARRSLRPGEDCEMKFEIPNTKLETNPKPPNPNVSNTRVLDIEILNIRTCLGFGGSDFGFGKLDSSATSFGIQGL